MANPVPTLSPDDFAQLTVPIVRWLARDHPWVSTALTLVGLMRLVAKPIFTLIHGDGANPDESKWFRFVAWILDFGASVKVRALTVENAGNQTSTKP
jgi:hypothetical protein